VSSATVYCLTISNQQPMLQSQSQKQIPNSPKIPKRPQLKMLNRQVLLLLRLSSIFPWPAPSPCGRCVTLWLRSSRGVTAMPNVVRIDFLFMTARTGRTGPAVPTGRLCKEGGLDASHVEVGFAAVTLDCVRPGFG
jgi:hypothetical protein